MKHLSSYFSSFAPALPVVDVELQKLKDLHSTVVQHNESAAKSLELAIYLLETETQQATRQ